MKRIILSPHAREQMGLRGATEAELEATISQGERLPARLGRTAFRKNFPFRSNWKGRYYETKQVVPIVVEEDETVTVVTVCVFYFGGPP